MHLKNTLLQKKHPTIYLYHLVDSHFTDPVEIMFVGRFPKTRFGPRFFMVGFLGRLLPWDSAGETFSGGFASFLLKGHPIPFKFPGCISKVYNSTYTYIAYMMYKFTMHMHSIWIGALRHEGRQMVLEGLQVPKFEKIISRHHVLNCFFSSLLAYRSFPSLSQSTRTGKSLQHHALSQNHPCLHQKYALGVFPPCKPR